VQVVFNSKRAYLDNQDVSYVQDNARFVMDILSRDIRLAGYKGCATEGAAVTSAIKQNVLPNVLGVAGAAGFLPLTGYESAGINEFIGIAANTDSLMIWRGDVLNDVALLADDPASNTFTFASSAATSNFKATLPMMIVDAKCQHVGIFTATAASATSVNHEVSGDNCTSDLKSGKNCATSFTAGSKYFAAGSRVMPYVAAGYFIGASTVSPGMPALKRLAVRTNAANNLEAYTEEIAQGVSDMQIKYGVVTGQGATATFVYQDAGFGIDWNNVVAVQLSLTFRSQGTWRQNNGALMTKTMNSTIQIRNRI